MKEITTIDSLKEIISSNFKYIIGFYDNKTDVYITYEVYNNPIDCIRGISKFLESLHLPLADVELHLIGRIDSTGLVSNMTEIYLLNPAMYYKELAKKEDSNN